MSKQKQNKQNEVTVTEIVAQETSAQETVGAENDAKREAALASLAKLSPSGAAVVDAISAALRVTLGEVTTPTGRRIAAYAASAAAGLLKIQRGRGFTPATEAGFVLLGDAAPAARQADESSGVDKTAAALADRAAKLQAKYEAAVAALQARKA